MELGVSKILHAALATTVYRKTLALVEVGRKSMNYMFSCYLVENQQFEPVLWILKLHQTFKEHCDKGGGLLNEDANHHHRVFTLLLAKRKQASFSGSKVKGNQFVNLIGNNVWNKTQL